LRAQADWTPPVVRTVATERKGLDALVASIAQHRTYLLAHGALEQARAKRAHERLVDLAGEALLQSLKRGRAEPLFERLCGQVRDGSKSPRAAVRELLEGLGL
jgi:LAO/AO transport system kinase